MNTPSRPRRHRPPTGVVRKKGIITIPETIREELDLQEGDEFIFSIEDGHIILTPAVAIPDEQEWFWTREWQEKEAEADAEIVAGHGRTPHDPDGFLSKLGALSGIDPAEIQEQS